MEEKKVEAKWTDEQKLAIYEKDKNILVAAAAGSGKTSVLVERIINKIINDKIDIDKILVVTFTKAAASEMKAKILNAIYKKIEENPDDKHLQRQIMLLSKASISTIHSFCLDVVKNNFFEIGISPNIKIAESTEIIILIQEVLEEIFDQKYENEDEEFLSLVNMYTSYKGDEVLKDMIISIYSFIQSSPFPCEWLEEKIEVFNIEDISFEKTPWGKILFEKAKEELYAGILGLKEELENIKYVDDSEKIFVTLSEDIRKINCVYETENWDDMLTAIQNGLSFDKFPTEKRVPKEIKDKIMKKRNDIKKSVQNVGSKILVYSSCDACESIRRMYSILLKVKNLIFEFDNIFSKVKLERNIMDFNDLEHFALKILTQNSDGGNHVCDKYRDKYEEILIDEYQDSNLVQESILTSVSRGNNIFMVGDVKQSIYKFRQACPELFLGKYDTYKDKSSCDLGENLRIQLFKNFRSRENVLKLTNIIFDSIMSRELGDINYTEEEFLNLGANYCEANNLEAEVHIIDLKDEEDSIYKDEVSEDEQMEEKVDDVILEAKFVANKIKEILDNGYVVSNKDNSTRKATYRDIAILLRTTKEVATIYEQEISKLNIPVFCDTASRLFRFSGNTSYYESA